MLSKNMLNLKNEYRRKILNPLRAYSVLKNKKWIDIEDKKKRINKLLSILDYNQQLLFIKLLDRFVRIDGKTATETEILFSFEKLYQEAWNNFFVYPIKLDNDHWRGSDNILRTIEHLKTMGRLDRFFLKIIKSTIDLTKISSNKKIVLVDDYIWTWETVLDFIPKFLSNESISQKNITKDDLIILTLAGQSAGIERIEKEGIKVCVWKIYNKWISDYYSGKEKIEMIETMRSIEQLVNWEGNLKSDYAFWYWWSEWLISFDLKCPNNTFPMFWFKKNYKDWQKWPFIFAR